MKKIIPLALAFMAIFYSPTTAQTASTDSGIDEDERSQIIVKGNKKIGLLFTYDKGKKKVSMVISLDAGNVKAGSPQQEEYEKIIIQNYLEKFKPKKVKIIRRIYAKEQKTGDLYFMGLTFKRC